MDAVAVGLLLVVLWLCWDIRRALGLRLRPGVSHPTPATTDRVRFRGAVPPVRFLVVRWPDAWQAYAGCEGAKARATYEHLHPRSGEEVEFWELDQCRGRKVG